MCCCNTLEFLTSCLTFDISYTITVLFEYVHTSAGVCFPGHVQACIRDSQANVCKHSLCLRMYVCARVWLVAVRPWLKLRQRTSFIEKSAVFSSPIIIAV